MTPKGIAQIEAVVEQLRQEAGPMPSRLSYEYPSEWNRAMKEYDHFADMAVALDSALVEIKAEIAEKDREIIALRHEVGQLARWNNARRP